jgi:hypothetical protein
MINKKELAICKVRGHDGHAYTSGWTQCKWCGIWRRTVTTVEERESEPPEEELDIRVKTDRGIASLQSKIAQAGIEPPAKRRRKK